MLECPQCHKVFDRGAFCNMCGVDLLSKTRSIASTRPSHHSANYNERSLLWLALIIALVVIGIMAYPKLQEHIKMNADSVPVARGLNGQETVSRPGQVVARGEFVSESVSSVPQSSPSSASRRQAVEHSNTSLPAGKPQGNTVPIGPDGLPVDSVVATGIGALTHELGESELRRFSDETLCLLRNEYYVRHGYTFSGMTHQHLTDFYWSTQNKPWYDSRPEKGYNNVHTVPWDLFSKSEKDNIVTIQGIEHDRGSWHITHTGPIPPEPYPKGD